MTSKARAEYFVTERTKDMAAEFVNGSKIGYNVVFRQYDTADYIRIVPSVAVRLASPWRYRRDAWVATKKELGDIAIKDAAQAAMSKATVSPNAQSKIIGTREFSGKGTITAEDMRTTAKATAKATARATAKATAKAAPAHKAQANVQDDATMLTEAIVAALTPAIAAAIAAALAPKEK